MREITQLRKELLLLILTTPTQKQWNKAKHGLTGLKQNHKIQLLNNSLVTWMLHRKVQVGLLFNNNMPCLVMPSDIWRVYLTLLLVIGTVILKSSNTVCFILKDHVCHMIDGAMREHKTGKDQIKIGLCKNALKLPDVFQEVSGSQDIWWETTTKKLKSYEIDSMFLKCNLKKLKKHFLEAWETTSAIMLLIKKTMPLQLQRTTQLKLKKEWLLMVAMLSVSTIALEIQEWSLDAPAANAQDKSRSRWTLKMLVQSHMDSSTEILFKVFKQRQI